MRLLFTCKKSSVKQIVDNLKFKGNLQQFTKWEHAHKSSQLNLRRIRRKFVSGLENVLISMVLNSELK
jgi:hypothetical protein